MVVLVTLLCVEWVVTLCVEFVRPLCVEVMLVSLEDEGGDMDWQDPLTVIKAYVK